MKKSDGAPVVDMSVLMGANVANEVAKGDFAEATIGCTNAENGLKWCKLFNTKDFAVQAVTDVAGAELCGAMKNVVALGAGFCDGLGYGGNTKAAPVRVLCPRGGGRDETAGRATRMGVGRHHPHRPQGDAEVLQRVLRHEPPRRGLDASRDAAGSFSRLHFR